jgi:YidC/Oxa1 family membrane protein insertase
MEQESGFSGRTIIIIGACIAIWWGWQTYLTKKYPEAMKASATTQTRPLPQPGEKEANKKAPSSGQAATQTGETKSQKDSSGLKVISALGANTPEEKWTYEDADWKIAISNHGARVTDVVLEKYTDVAGKPIELVTPDQPGYLTTSITSGGNQIDLSTASYTMNKLSDKSVEFTTKRDGFNIKKTMTVVPHAFELKVETKVEGDLSSVQKIGVGVSQPAPKAGQSGGFLRPAAASDLQEYFFSHGTKTDRVHVTGKDTVDKTFDQTHFASIGSRYFTALMFNRSNIIPTGEASSSKNGSFLRLDYPVLDPKVPMTIDYDFYAGPKLLANLKAVDPAAAKVVDFGMFSIIAEPILDLMKLFYNWFKNWGVAIIVLTLLVRGITYPFTYMSYKSMKAMQKIQPEIARLKEIYKNDNQRLNVEMMKLMKDNKVNPMGGCLPMILQLPIFWALYQVLQNSIELYHSPFVLWITDLSMKDPYYVLPVLMGVTMFAQQKMTPTAMDPSQAKIMMIMPIFFSFLMANLPAGLTLYIFVSTLFGIFQQLFMMKDRRMAQQAVVRRS